MSRLDETRTGGAMEELPESECRQLLGAKSVGRIGFAGPAGPVILPVNYLFDEGTVLFRTAPYNSVAAALQGASAAFEIDDIDDFLQSGWSVLVQGQASYVDEDEDIMRKRFNRPDPWVEGSRTLYIRISPRTITGRRVHPA